MLERRVAGLDFFAAHSERNSSGGRYIRYPKTEKGLTGTVALVVLTLVELLRDQSASLDPMKRQTLMGQFHEYMKFCCMRVIQMAAFTVTT